MQLLLTPTLPRGPQDTALLGGPWRFSAIYPVQHEVEMQCNQTTCGKIRMEPSEFYSAGPTGRWGHCGATRMRGGQSTIKLVTCGATDGGARPGTVEFESDTNKNKKRPLITNGLGTIFSEGKQNLGRRWRIDRAVQLAPRSSPMFTVSVVCDLGANTPPTITI
jgi:hypothetical protein